MDHLNANQIHFVDAHASVDDAPLAGDAPADTTPITTPVPAPAPAPVATVQFLFIDAGVPDADSFLASVDPAIHVVRLNAHEDGLTQIARALAGRNDVSAIHLVSHGDPGSISLGSGTLDIESLAAAESELATIRDALTADADLLLYGCDVAGDDKGMAFLSALADATGADVAASTNVTGTPLTGGNWQLEAHVGTVQTLAIEALDYSGTLGTDSSLPSGLQGNGPTWTWGGQTFQTRHHGEITTSDPLNPLREGSRWDRYSLDGIPAGSTVRVYMGNSSTVDDYIQIERNGSVLVQNDDGGDGERSYDAYVSWTYQPGDVIRATTFSSGNTGTYTLWISSSAGAATVGDIGSAPAPAPPPPTAPTFTAGTGLLTTYTDTGASNTFNPVGGTLSGTDSTPNGGMSFSVQGSNVGSYGTLSVSSNGTYSYAPSAAAINALAAGVNASDSFTVRITDGGGLFSTGTISVNVVGANDTPTLASDASMPGILEDAGASAQGATIGSVFGPRFVDVDNGASLGGLVVVGNTADAETEGRWQYSTDGGGTWHDVGNVGAGSGLALSASTRLHFVPVANYNGTPGGLTVHAADNQYGGGYSSGASRVTFDTTSDALTSGVSVGSRALDIAVAAVNDAPTFTSAAGAATINDSSAWNGSVSAASGALTGTLAATDVDHASNTLSYSIRGGSLDEGAWTLVGRYGTLTLDATTHTWTYEPGNLAAINALAAGEVAHDLFEFRVADPAGAYRTQQLDITLNGTNDLPVLAAALSDQSFSGGGTWHYQLPATTFTDAEGRGLTYTVEVLDSEGGVIGTIGASTGGNASLPSSWLSFDEGTRTFSGNPSASWGDAPVTLRVTATDPSGASVSDIFALTLSGTDNQAPVVSSPLALQVVAAATEVTSVTFGSTLGGTTIAFDGSGPITLGTAASGTDVASAVLLAFQEGSTNYSAMPVDGSPDTIRFTANTVGALADLTSGAIGGSFATLGGGTATVNVVTQGANAVAERQRVVFNDWAVDNIVFDGITVNVQGANSEAAIASLMLAAINNSSPNWTAVADTQFGADALILTYRTAGVNVGQLSPSAFLADGEYPAAQITATLTNGAAAVREVVDVQFTGALGGSTVVLDGITATAGAAVSGADVAAALANVTATLPGSAIAGVGVGNQGGTTFTWERTDMTFGDQTWAAGATVTLTVPRYDTSGTAFTVTTAALGANPTGAEIAAAVRAAILTAPNAGPGQGGYSDYAAVNVDNDGTNVGYGDYVANNYGATLYLWSTSSANTTDLTSSILQANVPGLSTNYQLGTASGALVATARQPGAIADINAGSFTGTYTGTPSVNVTTQGSGWTYQIPGGTFTDAENDTLTYAAYAIDDEGHATLIGNAGGALSFDPSTRTLSGNGSALSANIIEIRATDTAGSNTTAVTRLPLFLDDGTHQVVSTGTAIDSLSFGTGAGAHSAQIPADAFVYAHLGGSLTYSATLASEEPLPSWLSFDAATGTFSGNPPDGATSLSIVVRATDSEDNFADSAPFTLDLGNPNDPLVVVSPIADQALAAGNAFNLTVPAPFSNPDGTTAGGATTSGIAYSATANGQPLADFGLTLVVNGNGTITFSGNPPGGTPYLNIVVIGTEEAGETTATTSFTLNLSDPEAGAGALSANNTGTVAITGTPTQGQTLTAAAPADPDGYTGGVTYQWQVNTGGGWVDVAGSRGQATTLTLTQAEVGQVRVQAFYTDNGGVPEAPVSSAVSVANVNDSGAVSITGSPSIGQTVNAALTDADGLAHATPSYQWYRGNSAGTANEAISGATYSSYTVTNADGGKFLRVVVSYTDDHESAEAPSATTAFAINLGDIAPVAANDTGSATEAGGIANATAGTAATGNLLANDSDANSNISPTAPVASLRSGGTEGLGNMASVEDGYFTVAGLYGTLVVNRATGAYTYTVDNSNESVQALNSGGTLVDRFNYTVQDATLLNDTAVLAITVNGANDRPSMTNVPVSASFTEDIAAQLRLESQLVDPDLGNTFALRMQVTAGTLTASGNDDVTVSGSDTGTLIVTGSMQAVQLWLGDGGLHYTGAPDSNAPATLTWSVDDGSGYVTAGTTTLLIAEANDAAVLDLNGSNGAGNHFTTTFRPRGNEVAVVDNDVRITDIDDTLVTGATVTLATGAADNSFGTLYETLRSSAGTSFTTGSGTITISGNGSTTLTFSGSGTHAEYEALLRTVLYNNSNPNAYAGDRTITITLTDAASTGSNGALASNVASFTTAAANNAIAVGQHIFVGGVDTGHTVAQVVDNRHFVASGPLAGLAPGAQLSFQSGGAQVTTAVQSGPVVATTTVQVPWTPVVDMNGEGNGRNHAVTYTEGGLGVAVARADASITDQDGNIAQVVVTLGNPQDGSSEMLTISSTLVTQLGLLGITVTGNNSHAITLSGDRDSTFFQVGLRAVRYVNESQNPTVLDRVVTVSTLDVNGNTGVDAQTVITMRAVNDAPNGLDSSINAFEDTAHVFTALEFGFADPVDGVHSLAAVRIATLPAHGVLSLDGVAVTAGQTISLADLGAGRLTYLPAANRTGTADTTFTFQVQDDGGTLYGGIDLDPTPATMTINVTPVNDAPVLTAAAPTLSGLGEDTLNSAGHTVATFVAAGPGSTGISDIDTGTSSAQNGTGRGIALYGTHNLGPASGGTWQYSTNGGSSWSDVGSVSDSQALLLRSTDLVRFVPDGQNATVARFDYYAWDGATGSAGTRVDAGTRGGTTAFSLAGDTASINVTAVNDAPTIDLDANNSSGATGNDFLSIFSARGAPVPVVDADIAIGDPDRLSSGTDTLVSATLTITAGDLDNLFGTTYETLSSTLEGSYVGSLGAITFSGNGTTADPLVLSGAGTWADYQAALRTVVYDNANPNAFAGDRTVQISVRDAAGTTGGSGALDSAVATTTIRAVWAPVADLDGSASAGRSHEIIYTEGSAGVAIAASNASIVDQDGNIATVVVSIVERLDGAAEQLFIDPAFVTQLGTAGITVTGNHSGAITLSGNRDGTTFQLGLRAIQYVNTSDSATSGTRTVSVALTDQQGNIGVGADTVINLVGVNDAPLGVDSAVTLLEDATHVFSVADFGFTDLEGHALASVRITTLPNAGTLTLNGNAVGAGQFVTAADIAAGHLVFTPADNANNVQNPNGAGAGHASLTFQVRDAGGTAGGGVDLDATANTMTINVAPVNDLPTGGIGLTGTLRVGQVLGIVDFINDVDGLAEMSFRWQSRSPDGSWFDIGGATAATYTLTADDANREMRALVTYADAPSAPVVFGSEVSGEPAFVADADGNLTLTLTGSGPTLIRNPLGNVTIVNNGSGTVTVQGLPPGGTVTTSGSGPVVVHAPQGDITLVNNSTGPVTVTGLPGTATLTTTGSGNTTVSAPATGATVINTGGGTTTVTGVTGTIHTGGTGAIVVSAPADGAVIDDTGSGTLTVNDPAGNLTVNNGGGGTATVNHAHAGSTVTTSGAVTLADPLGDLTLAGTGTNSVTGLPGTATLTATGSGDTTVSAPADGATVLNNGSGTTTVTGVTGTVHTGGTGAIVVSAPADGAVIDDTGSGTLTVNDPAGDLTVNNGGGGTATVNHAHAGSTVTTSGAVTLADPLGNLTLAGTGTNTVTGLLPYAELTATGSGGTTVGTPGAGAFIINNGSGTVSVDGATSVLYTGGTGAIEVHAPAAGTIVNDTGTGTLTVNDPAGDLTVNNGGGGGTATVHQAAAGSTVTTSGAVTLVDPLGDVTLAGSGSNTVTGLLASATLGNTGASQVTVSAPASGATVLNNGSGTVTVTGVDGTLNTGGTGAIVVNAPADGAVINDTGSGTLTVNGPAGDLTVHNGNGGNVVVHQVAEGSDITTTGAVTLADPLGSFALHHDDAAVVTVTGMLAGETLTLQGNGPVVLDTHLASGERITVDTSAGGNLRLSLTGDGTVDVVGGLNLGQDSTLELALNGSGAQPLTSDGNVVLDGTALVLDLGYDAMLGDRITLLSNTGSQPISGTFADLPEGGTFYLQGGLFSISYAGGDGNDIVLTRVNDAPQGSVTVSGTPTQGEVLTAGHTLADTDGLGAITYAWMRGSTLVGTGASYTTGQADVGANLRVVASYTDAQGTVEQVQSAATAAVANVNDLPTGSVRIVGTPTQGRTLTASHTLADADGLGAISYLWMSGVSVLGSGSSYTLTQADVGRSIELVASYTDAFGALETVASEPTAAVANVNDAPTGQVQISGIVDVGQTLTVSNSLADVDGLGAVTYRWMRGDTEVGSGSSYEVAAADAGHSLHVTAGYIDGHGGAESVDSAATSRVNPVSSAVEASVPAQGAQGMAGDGNGDGIADVNQADVVSALLQPMGGSAPSSFVTLVANSNEGQTTPDSDTLITGFTQSDTFSAPPMADAPLGQIGFTATTPTPGASETFSLYVDASVGANGFWVHDANGTLVNLASAAFGGQVVQEGDRTRLDFRVADGSQFDGDAVANGSVDVAGLAGYMPLSLLGYLPDLPGQGTDDQPIWG